MKSGETNIKGWWSASFFLISIVSLLGVHSCESESSQIAEAADESESKNVVEVITETMEFQMPDTISSGWNTWRYINKSTQPHFILIDNYPEGITLDSVRKRVLPVFGNGMTLINEGKVEEGFAEFGKLPQWFSEVQWPGGVGLISSGQTAETMLKLDPGYYLVECYVKINTGMFHTNMGMIEELVVSEDRSNMKEPTADYVIEISSDAGIVFDPPVNPGKYTFTVNYLDQATYDNFLGHDVNLVKVEDDEADLKNLEAWMDWRDPEGLIDPGPEGFTFLGGMNDMPEGSRGYFTANIKPGKYVLISEVPNASEKNLLKSFVVSK